MTENVVIAIIVIGTMLLILANRNHALEREVNDRHYYSRWARPFRWTAYDRIDPSLPPNVQRAEWRTRRKLQRRRRHHGLSIHDPA